MLGITFLFQPDVHSGFGSVSAPADYADLLVVHRLDQSAYILGGGPELTFRVPLRDAERLNSVRALVRNLGSELGGIAWRYHNRSHHIVVRPGSTIACANALVERGVMTLASVGKQLDLPYVLDRDGVLRPQLPQPAPQPAVDKSHIRQIVVTHTHQEKGWGSLVSVTLSDIPKYSLASRVSYENHQSVWIPDRVLPFDGLMEQIRQWLSTKERDCELRVRDCNSDSNP